MTGNLAHEVGEVAARSASGEGAAYRTVHAANSTEPLTALSPSSLRASTSTAQRER
jgi:hypothetical protein